MRFRLLNHAGTAQLSMTSIQERLTNELTWLSEAKVSLLVDLFLVLTFAQPSTTNLYVSSHFLTRFAMFNCSFFSSCHLVLFLFFLWRRARVKPAAVTVAACLWDFLRVISTSPESLLLCSHPSRSTRLAVSLRGKALSMYVLVRLCEEIHQLPVSVHVCM